MENRVKWQVISLIAVGSDIITTVVGLAYFSLHEANPFVSYLGMNISVFLALKFIISVVLIKFFSERALRMFAIATWIIVAWNIIQITL